MSAGTAAFFAAGFFSAAAPAFAAGFFAGAFLAAAFFFGLGAAAARASISDAASSSVNWSGVIDLGSVAFVSPSVT